VQIIEDGEPVKCQPLAYWEFSDCFAYLDKYSLERHPLHDQVLTPFYPPYNNQTCSPHSTREPVTNHHCQHHHHIIELDISININSISVSTSRMTSNIGYKIATHWCWLFSLCSGIPKCGRCALHLTGTKRQMVRVRWRKIWPLSGTISRVPSRESQCSDYSLWYVRTRGLCCAAFWLEEKMHLRLQQLIVCDEIVHVHMWSLHLYYNTKRLPRTLSYILISYCWTLQGLTNADGTLKTECGIHSPRWRFISGLLCTSYFRVGRCTTFREDLVSMLKIRRSILQKSRHDIRSNNSRTGSNNAQCLHSGAIIHPYTSSAN